MMTFWMNGTYLSFHTFQHRGDTHLILIRNFYNKDPNHYYPPNFFIPYGEVRINRTILDKGFNI